MSNNRPPSPLDPEEQLQWDLRITGKRAARSFLCLAISLLSLRTSSKYWKASASEFKFFYASVTSMIIGTTACEGYKFHEYVRKTREPGESLKFFAQRVGRAFL